MQPEILIQDFELLMPPNKSKMNYSSEYKKDWEPNKREKYMDVLTRNQAIVIFQTRYRMIRVKCNYKNMHRDLKCRACKKEEETQTHVLEICPNIHVNNSTKVKKDQIFSGDTDTIRETAKKIMAICQKIENVY